LNDPVFFDCAQALGQFVCGERPAAKQRIITGSNAVSSREPNKQNWAIDETVRDSTQAPPSKPDNAATPPGQASRKTVVMMEAATLRGLSCGQ
jgi:hypothetical protein